MLTIRAADRTGDFQAYLAIPERAPGPGVVIAQEIFGVNQVMRDVADWYAARGFVAIVPDLFWRQAPGVELSDQSQADRERALQLYQGLNEAKAVEDCATALEYLRAHSACSGPVGVVGYCLGGKLAYLLAVRATPDCAVGYYGVGIENALDEAEGLACPLMLHVAGQDEYCDASAQKRIHDHLDAGASATIHDYADCDHAFARPGGAHHHPIMAELANLRTLEFMREHLCPNGPNLAAIWDEHVRYEFETRDHVDTLKTMVDDAYVNHIPTLTGGVGKTQLTEFYSKRFIPQMPPDTSMTQVSRTIGADRVVDEMIFKFTHTCEMDWMLPGIPPTNKPVEIPLVAIVHFRGDKLAHEHIYWDQASVLVQLGLLDPSNLPVAGIETAQKVLDTTIASNALIERADRRRSTGA